MDQFIAKGVEVLFGYGLPGLIIAYLIYERRLLQDQISKLMDNNNKIQESRILEAREVVTALSTIADTIEIFKDFMKENRWHNQHRGQG